MRQDIRDYAEMFELGLMDYGDFATALKNLVWTSQFYGLTTREAIEMIQDMGFWEEACY